MLPSASTEQPGGKEVAVDYQQWEENGYIVLKDFFSQEQIASVNDFIDQAWATRNSSNVAITIDAFLDTPMQKRMRLSAAPDESRQAPYKINDLYLESELVRSMILDNRLTPILSNFLGGDPMVCNSLNFEYGSQQNSHTDSLYMTPRVRNKLVASWIALDEIDDSNGPVEYYPGSHKIPPYEFSNGGISAIGSEMAGYHSYMEKQLQEREIHAEKFTAQAGDVLVWHSQLLHGGTKILDPSRLRRSLVTHYFRKQDYWHHLWRVRKSSPGAYFYRRNHAAV